MPVTYNKEKQKWCVGSNCVYDTEESAQKAYKGYLASENTKKAFRLGVASKLAESGVTIDEFQCLGAEALTKEGRVTDTVKGTFIAALGPALLASLLMGVGGYAAGRSPLGDVLNLTTDFGSPVNKAVQEKKLRDQLTEELGRALDLSETKQRQRISRLAQR